MYFFKKTIWFIAFAPLVLSCGKPSRAENVEVKSASNVGANSLVGAWSAACRKSLGGAIQASVVFSESLMTVEKVIFKGDDCKVGEESYRVRQQSPYSMIGPANVPSEGTRLYESSIREFATPLSDNAVTELGQLYVKLGSWTKNIEQETTSDYVDGQPGTHHSVFKFINTKLCLGDATPDGDVMPGWAVESECLSRK